MSAFIQESLNILYQKVEALEVATEQKALRARQEDLFNDSVASTTQAAVNTAVNTNEEHGSYDFDPSVLAEKLDVAIERVEQVLKEA